MRSPSAARNIGPIGDVLHDWLPDAGLVLEIASGSGEHALAFSRRFPALSWQPTDPDAGARASIAGWQEAEGGVNLLPPLALDAEEKLWLVPAADAVVAINMVHISPWTATLGLMAGASRLLPDGGVLILYGPYRETDRDMEPSNLAFNQSLKARNAAWGVRDLADVQAAAGDAGFLFQDKRRMPACNLMLLFRKASVEI